MKSVVYFLAVLIAIIVFVNSKSIGVLDFDRLMGQNEALQIKELTNYTFYEQLYLKNIPLLKEKNASLKIPKVLHLVWTGSEPFPLDSVKYVKSLKRHHPDWTFKFWTDDLSRPLPIDGMQKQLIDKFSKEELRFQILYTEGGVYVDHNTECYQPFDPLNTSFDFYCGLMPPQKNGLVPSNAIIGSVDKHPVIKAAMEQTFAKGVLENAGKDRRGDIIFPASFAFAASIFSKNTFELLKNDGFCFAKEQLIENKRVNFEAQKVQLKESIVKTKNEIKLYSALSILMILAAVFINRKEKRS